MRIYSKLAFTTPAFIRYDQTLFVPLVGSVASTNPTGIPNAEWRK